MSHQIIQQPDGRLAVWSSVVDDIVVYDATAEEIAAWEAQAVYDRIHVEVLAKARSVEVGEARPYYQFTMTWDEMQEERTLQHGAPWAPNQTEPLP